jgi:hypothetical protein
MSRRSLPGPRHPLAAAIAFAGAVAVPRWRGVR